MSTQASIISDQLGLQPIFGVLNLLSNLSDLIRALNLLSNRNPIWIPNPSEIFTLVQIGIPVRADIRASDTGDQSPAV